MEMRNRPAVNPSALTDGWHPGFLIHISEEPTPPDWQMFKQSPTMWRWHFLVWEIPTLIDRQAPEQQSGLTSTKFAPKGKFQASKSYVWTKQLLGRDIPRASPSSGTRSTPSRAASKSSARPGKDFIKILDVEAWPEGQPFTVSMAEPLRLARAEAMATPPPVIPPVTPPRRRHLPPRSPPPQACSPGARSTARRPRSP